MGSMNLENKTTALDDDAAIYQHTEATETAKSLRQKLSEMTFKEKVRYLLDYYGLKALIVLAVLIFLGYTLWAMLRPKPETVAQIAIIDNPWDTALLDDYQEELIEKLKLDTKKQELPLGYSYRSSNLSDGTALSTFLFANNLDILISSKDEISRYAENGVFYPLEDNLPADLKAVISEEDCLRRGRRRTRLRHPHRLLGVCEKSFRHRLHGGGLLPRNPSLQRGAPRVLLQHPAHHLRPPASGVTKDCRTDSPDNLDFTCPAAPRRGFS